MRWVWVAVGVACASGGCGRDSTPTSEQPAAYEQRGLPVNADDVAILERADTILADVSVWDRADDRVCEGDDQVSLFCALQRASVEVLGQYDHRRVALQEVRFAIEARGREYAHRLMDFNNDPTTTFADVKAVLREATMRVKARLAP